MSDGCTVYGESLPFDRDDPRIEKFFCAIESALPATKIDQAILSSRYKWQPVSDRVQLVNERLFDKAKSTRGHLTTIFGNGRRDDEAVMVTLGKYLKGSVEDQRRAEMSLPSKFEMRKIWSSRVNISNQRKPTCMLMPRLLAAVCAATDCIDGWADSDVSLGQMHRSAQNVKKGIPCIGSDGKQYFAEWVLQPGERSYDIVAKPLAGQMQDGFRFPMYLRWVNYWSDSVAKALNFPDPKRDRPLEGLYERIDDKGWLVQLTKEPLDLDIPEHLERLNWAYSRFSVSFA